MLRSGDALMLYTDGMVETRTTDIGIGIDRLIGQADRKLCAATSPGARRPWSTRSGSRADDRALLLVWRDCTARRRRAGGVRVGARAGVAP